MNKWDRRFVKMARMVAKWSKDPDKKVGAILVSPDKRRVSWGFNGFPIGISDSDVRLKDRELKNAMVLHAEHNAVLNANTNVRGWTLYCTSFPCTQCALVLIQSDVRRVVLPPLNPDSSWFMSHCRAMDLMREAGVDVSIYDEYEV